MYPRKSYAEARDYTDYTDYLICETVFTHTIRILEYITPCQDPRVVKNEIKVYIMI